MNDFPRYKLISLIKKYGDKLYYNKTRCRNLLNDFCGKYKREVFVLSTAVEENVPQELLCFKESNNFSLQPLIVQLKERLKENYAFTDSASLWAVETWALALDILTENDELQQSLFFAVLIANLDLIADLIELGVDLNYKDYKDRTALIYAVISGNRIVVDKLLTWGVKTEIKDKTGYTALHWAIMLGEEEIVQSLLKAEAKVNNKTDQGYTALDLAQHYHQEDIYKILTQVSN